jgi:hypothetical protein
MKNRRKKIKQRQNYVLPIFRPLVFTFAAETDEFIQCEEKKLRQQIESLQDISFSVGHSNFVLKVSIKHLTQT